MLSPSLVNFRRLARVAALFAAVVVVVGAWVRLTQAGLGCPDWPGCYGHVHPASVVDQAVQAGAAYGRAFNYEKALHEMLHRYIASTLGVMIVVLAALSVWNRRNPDQPRVLPWIVLGLVLVQGALGAFTVTLLVIPLIVTLHLAGGLTTMALLYWMSLAPEARQADDSDRSLRRFAAVILGVTILQVLLGGWTSTNYAAPACPDFPTCQGTVLPHADYSQAFVLWRGLGVDYEGGVLSTPARTAIHLTHRAGAIVVGASVLLLSFFAFRGGRTARVRLAALAVGAAVLLQWLIGMNLIWRGFPLWLGTAHNAGAVLLLLSILTLLRTLWPHPGAGVDGPV
jgi:cytochrome c oxidase assembly protein subunit 15